MSMPAEAKELGVQMSKNVPPPPSVTQRLGYWLSQRRFASGSAVRLLLYGFVRVPSRLTVPCPPRNRTSFIIEAAPAIHFAATARGLMPFVYSPIPMTTFVPPFGASIIGFGGPAPWKARVLSGSTSCVASGCRPMSTVSGRSSSVSLMRYEPDGT